MVAGISVTQRTTPVRVRKSLRPPPTAALITAFNDTSNLDRKGFHRPSAESLEGRPMSGVLRGKGKLEPRVRGTAFPTDRARR